MLTIKFVGASHPEGLVRSADDRDWFDTPIGMPTKSNSGPMGKTCLSCANLDVAVQRWSDKGPASVCLERPRLAHGKKVQEVPVHWPACSRYTPRQGLVAALAEADRCLDERLLEKRTQAKDLKAALDRVAEEIRELELMRAASRTEPGDAAGPHAKPTEEKPLQNA
jgi:hypothetical protein